MATYGKINEVTYSDNWPQYIETITFKLMILQMEQRNEKFS